VGSYTLSHEYLTTRQPLSWERSQGSHVGAASGFTSPLRNASTYRDQIYVTYHDLEEALRRRGYSLYRLSLFTLVSVGGVATLYWGRIKTWSAQEGAEVASKTLEDERLLMKAEHLAKNVANALLTDAETSVAAQGFLSEIAVHESSTELAKTFALEICKSLLQDKEVRAQATNFMGEVLKTEPVWNSAKELGMHVVTHPEFKSKGLESIKQVFRSPEFKAAGIEYLADGFTKTLQTDTVKAQAVQSTKDVLNTQELRESAGQAIWAATKSGILGMRVPQVKHVEPRPIEVVQELSS